jgi:hypothetical protein
MTELFAVFGGPLFDMLTTSGVPAATRTVYAKPQLC